MLVTRVPYSEMGSYLLLLPEVVFDLNRDKWAAAHFNYLLISLMPTYNQCPKQKKIIISCFMTIESN